MATIKTLVFTLEDDKRLHPEERNLTREELEKLRIQASRAVVERTDWGTITSDYNHILYYSEKRDADDNIAWATVYLDSLALTDKELDSLSKELYIEALHRRA